MKSSPRISRTSPRWVLPTAGAVALGALLWACRGGLPGVPVADDYDYLAALAFEHPLDPWGPMGSLWYWRPLGRQLYFALLGPQVFSSPWLVGVVHALVFAACYAAAARAARRAFDPWTAAGIGAFPLLAEPARALLVWPTGAQPLLAMAFIATALHEAAARRMWSALVALAAALLCHDQALLLVPLLPLLSWARGEPRPVLLRWGGGVALVTLAYAAGRAVAFGHGASVPVPGPLATALQSAPRILVDSLLAQLGLDGLHDGPRGTLLGLMIACGVGALVVYALRPAARARAARRGPLLVAGAAWFALAIAPLAFTPDLWTPRHTCLPGLGLAVLFVGGLGAASPGLAVAFTGLRLVALLAAPTVPPAVDMTQTPSVRPLSFLHLTRMQRTAESARALLVARHPTLPPGARVGYWSLPRDTEIAFAGPRALRTWYADSTLQWEFWDRYAPDPGPRFAAVLGFNVGVRDPAVLMRPGAIAPFRQALAIGEAGDLAGADQALARAFEAQEPQVDAFAVEIVRLRARLAFRQGMVARADSLNEVDRGWSGETASYWGMAALVALARGDTAAAADRANRCLALRPDDAEGHEVRAALARQPTGPPGH